MAAQFHYDFQIMEVGELFALIGKAKESKRQEVVAQGQYALEEFRRRYEKHVNRFVRSACSRLLCSVCAEEVVDGVFEMVWELADASSLDPTGDKKVERHRVCLWLGSPICQNIIKQLNDKELLDRALRRDEGEYERAVSDRAFARFVALHEKKLRWHCTQFSWGTLSEMEVEELVQDTFIRAWQRAHTYKDYGITDTKRLRCLTDGWLNEIAYNLFLDGLDSRKDVKTVAFDDEAEIDNLAAREMLRQLLQEDAAQADTAHGELLEKLEELSEQSTREALLLVLTDVERAVLQTDQQDFRDADARSTAFKILDARLKLKAGTRRQHLKRAKDKIRRYVEARLIEYLRSLGLLPPDDE